MENKTGIPILYYHSIADHEHENEWSFLSISISLFKKQMDYLYKKGYYACDWKELDDHINGVKKLPEKTVMFHFDDGFLDNWSVVFPIMEEKKFKYSIVVTPEFIEKGNVLRPFVTKTTDSNKADWWGYLNETEIKFMSDSGLVDFQAHGYSHTWYESSDKLVDINNGEKFYPHLGWNKSPEQKPYWLLNKVETNPAYPVFEFKKTLELSNRFFPNDILISRLLKSYDKEQSKSQNMEVYQQIIEEFKENGEVGRFENKEEARQRLMHELEDTRNYISKITGKPTDYLVFPGGGLSDLTISLCKKAGYRLISKGSNLNLYGSNIYQVERYSATFTFPKLVNEYLNLFFLKLQLKRAKGNLVVTKLFNLLRP